MPGIGARGIEETANGELELLLELEELLLLLLEDELELLLLAPPADAEPLLVAAVPGATRLPQLPPYTACPDGG
jgi:hypothetical protein